MKFLIILVLLFRLASSSQGESLQPGRRALEYYGIAGKSLPKGKPDRQFSIESSDLLLQVNLYKDEALNVQDPIVLLILIKNRLDKPIWVRAGDDLESFGLNSGHNDSSKQVSLTDEGLRILRRIKFRPGKQRQTNPDETWAFMVNLADFYSLQDFSLSELYITGAISYATESSRGSTLPFRLQNLSEDSVLDVIKHSVAK
jgi:hypothetical protein